MNTSTMTVQAAAHTAPARVAQQTAQQAEAGQNFSQVLGAAAQAQNGAAGLAGQYTVRDAQQAVLLSGLMKLAQDGGEPVVADPVLAQLLEMLKGMESGEDNSADILKLAEQLQRRLDEILERGGGEMAGQQALAVMSAFMPDMQAAGAADMPAQSADAVLNMLMSVKPETLARLIAPEESGAKAGEAAKAVFSAEAGTAAQTAQAKDGAGGLVKLPAAAGAEMVIARAAGGGVQSFEAAVRMAKQQMQAEPKTGAETPEAPPKTDVDALQKQVDAGIFMQGTAMAAQQPEGAAQKSQLPVPAPEVQLREGAAAGMARGENEFTVKLAPEGLGEVTIRLHESGAKMTMEIIAKNPETQKLLAGQMDLLREALRPLKVEVEPVVSEGQFEMLSERQRQFGGQARQNPGEMRGAAYYGDEPLAGEAAQAVPAAESLAAALNTLV